MKTKKPWTTLKINLTIESDENGDVWQVNVNDGYKSISYDDYVPTLKELLEDFDY